MNVSFILQHMPTFKWLGTCMCPEGLRLQKYTAPWRVFFFHSEATIMILIMILPWQDQDRGFATHNRSFATKKNLCRAPRVSTQALTHERPEDAWIYFVGLLLGWNCLTL